MSNADKASPVQKLVRTPGCDGLITAVNGKKLPAPVPFKKGENIFIRIIEHPKDGHSVASFIDVEWVEF